MENNVGVILISVLVMWSGGLKWMKPCAVFSFAIMARVPMTPPDLLPLAVSRSCCVPRRRTR